MHVAFTPPFGRPLSAARLARRYDLYLAAVWLGRLEAAAPFAEWVGGFWGDGPAEPGGPPAAVSAFGPPGPGVRWHETPSAILGYPAGGGGCCRVPRTAPLPSPDGGPRRPGGPA